jgi:hypothetical protein
MIHANTRYNVMLEKLWVIWDRSVVLAEYSEILLKVALSTINQTKPVIYILEAIYTSAFRVEVIFIPRTTWYEWFVALNYAISHLGHWLLHLFKRITKQQPRFKGYNFSNSLAVFRVFYRWEKHLFHHVWFFFSASDWIFERSWPRRTISILVPFKYVLQL